MDNLTLLGQVKRKLNITWEDDDTNARVEEMVESLIPDMIYMLGIRDDSFDFSLPGVENTLFLAYCLYEWNHATEEFEENYSKKLEQTKAKWLVKYSQEDSEENADAEKE